MLDSLFASLGSYFGSLKLSALMRALPGGLAQGLVWGILALGVFMITLYYIGRKNSLCQTHLLSHQKLLTSAILYSFYPL